MFSPEGGDNEGRGENHLVLQKSMLLTVGLKKRKTALLIVVDWKAGKEWEVGSRVYIIGMGRQP